MNKVCDQMEDKIVKEKLVKSTIVVILEGLVLEIENTNNASCDPSSCIMF